MKRLRRWLRDLLSRAVARLDGQMFNGWAESPNGSARLVAFHDAVVDADDTLEAIERALRHDDTRAALRFAALGRDSLKERIAELKGLL